MTTDRTKAAAQPNGATNPGERVLRRRSDERVIGGVASGIGDFLNVDPLLIRIGFAGLMVFGGLGLLLYVGGWLLMPDETTETSIAEQVVARAGLTPSRLGSILLILIGGILFFGAMTAGAELPGYAPTVAAAAIVIVVGIILLRQGDAGTTALRPPVARQPKPATAAAEREPLSAPVTRAAPIRRRRRPHSPLGWYIAGAMLAALGLLALVANVAATRVDPGQFFGLAVAVLGIGLVVGTWWGHARTLILVGLLLVPFAVAASFVTTPIEGGIGYHRFEPLNVGELRDDYRLVGGSLVLDLTEVDGGNEPITVTASVAMGDLFVALPEDAEIELDAAIGAGNLVLLGDQKYGTSIEDRVVRDGTGQRFILDLETGIGSVYVESCCNAVNR